MMPPSVSLCLACSASLPPLKADSHVYYTPCCSRPICPSCISANSRLLRYNPCLRCLAGVKAVNSRAWDSQRSDQAGTGTNVDGSIRDEDIFVVDDEDDSDEGEDGGSPASGRSSPHSLHQKDSAVQDGPGRSSVFPQAIEQAKPAFNHSEDTKGASGTPPKYYIRPDDTLLGISLKLGIDSRVICRLNNLSVSTLRTTPHLLHTRAFLLLPPSARPPPPSPAEQALDEERRDHLAIERAETRFQSMTKETDRAVARAYVALAGLDDDPEHLEATKECNEEKPEDVARGLRHRKPHAPDVDVGAGESSLEGRATDQYYDDEDWEARERAEGRKVAIPSFPYITSGSSSTAEKMPVGGQRPWWRWQS